MDRQDEVNRKLAEPRLVFEAKWWVSRRWRGRRSDLKIREFRRYLHTLPKAAVVIDCGANVGAIARVAARRGLEVHAFEPGPIGVQAIEEKRRSILQCEPLSTGRGIEPGSVPLYVVPARDLGSTINSSLFNRDGLVKSSTCVNVIDVISFIRRFPFVALLKLDVEGPSLTSSNAYLTNDWTEKSEWLLSRHMKHLTEPLRGDFRRSAAEYRSIR